MRSGWIACLALLALLAQDWNTQAAMLVSQEPEREPQTKELPKDSWFQHPPAALIIEPVKKTVVKWEKVDEADMYRVVQQQWPRAEAMLEKRPLVKLTPDQVQELTGKAAPKRSDKTPYLVRAVYYERGQGKYYAGILGIYLWVDHNSLGPYQAAMKRDALVVFLKTEPTQVFVTCGRTV